MPNFGNRFRRRHQRGGRLHPAVIVGICLGTAIIITVIVGNLLKLWLDDETYRKLTEGEETESKAEEIEETNVRNINAYPFILSDDPADVFGQSAVSVTLNSPHGTLQYTSDVSTYLDMEHNTDAELFETLSELGAFVPYISGVFYPQAFENELPDLRYTAANEEAALLREFLRAGGSEVLLVGLPINTPNLDAVTEYIKAVKFAVGNSPVGIAIPYATATDPDNWELLATLEPLCDFFAVDLTEEKTEDDLDESGLSASANALFANCGYLTSQYDARLLFTEAQTAIISTAEIQLRPDYQVIRYFKEAEPEPSESEEVQ